MKGPRHSREELAEHHAKTCLELLGDYPSMIEDMLTARLNDDAIRLLALVEHIHAELYRRTVADERTSHPDPQPTSIQPKDEFVDFKS